METLQRHRRLLQGAGAAPPPSTPSNFDMNMVIILAALLCALICALGLNSIVRCALRCSRRLASLEDNSDRVLAPATAARAVPVTRRGLRRSALRQIPVVVYGGDGGVKVIVTECAICLGELADGEKVRVLPRCKHGFHVRCIDPWLASHTSCPTCRRSIAENGAVVAIGAAAVAFGGESVEHGDVVVNVGDMDGG